MRHTEHGLRRLWWAPWRRMCRCGRTQFDCAYERVVQAQTLRDHAGRAETNPPQRWNGPTSTMLPLLTLGQQHRGGWPTNAERRPRDCRSDFPR